VLLIPWHLLRAIWGWLSFFALRYTGKPLLRAGAPEKEQQEAKDGSIVFSNGRTIEALGADGPRTRLFAGNLVQQVAIVG